MMLADVYPLLAVVGAYLLGSLSFAVIVSRVMGLSDPRTFGSKNPGATNVLRSGSKKAAIATLLLDALKGWLPVWLAQRWAGDAGWGDATIAFVALAAFLGHLYPVFFRFKGGKGVATAAGVLFGISPWLGLLVLLTWVLTAAISRYSSLAALVAAAAAPTIYLFGAERNWWLLAGPLFQACMVMSIVLIWRHRENVQRLLKKQESRIGEKKR